MPCHQCFFFTREKKNWTREKFQHFAREFSKLAEKKILKTAREKKLCPRKKHQNPTREKKALAREKKSNFSPLKLKKYLEILEFLPEKKINSSREKILNYARENFRLPEIFFFLSGREKKICPRKKPRKVPKNVFSGTFHFLGEKKNTISVYMFK